MKLIGNVSRLGNAEEQTPVCSPMRREAKVVKIEWADRFARHQNGMFPNRIRVRARSCLESTTTMGSSSVISKATFVQKERPTRVNWALAALWSAWTVSLAALLVNQLFYKGSGVGPGWVLGILSLAIQAVVFILVSRGLPMARGLTVAFLLLAVLPLPMVGRLMVEKSAWSATYLGLGFALKAVAVFLLFTGKANRWFSS